MTRQKARSHTPTASAAPIELAKNITAPSSITRSRPQRSEREPANIAPTAQPSRAMATTRPVTKSLSAKSPWMDSTAPLMTDESKPNRKPPTAAAIANAAARLP